MAAAKTKQTSRKGLHQASGCWIRTDKRLAIYLRDSFACIYCLRDLHGAEPTDITLDHLVCQSDGGSRYYTLGEGNVRVSDHEANEATDQWLEGVEGEQVRVDRRGWRSAIERITGV